MKIKSENIEFGYELISTLPYANWLHENGQLTATESAIDTKCLYFFSPNHKENSEPRSWFNTSKVKHPNINIHKSYIDKQCFSPPNLKKQYTNDKFKFEKETIVICNRVNIEWASHAINFFDIETLRTLFDLLKNQYQIIYINIEGKKEYYDNAPPIHFPDKELLQEFPEVIDIRDLHKKESQYTFNELQLMIFANCQKFITMNGGHAILAAYFGGENIIMSKYGSPQARELEPQNNSFYRWYNEFGDQRVMHVEDEEKLIKKVTDLWIKKIPIVNILVRTSLRPRHFFFCMRSIFEQDYNNINIFVSFDNEESNKYITPYKVYPVKVERFEGVIPLIENNGNFGAPFPSNLYLNDLFSKVKSGIVIYLDDDDILCFPDAISKIVQSLKNKDLTFWRVKCGERLIPKTTNFGKAPVCCDISGIGFAFKKEILGSKQWTPYKRCDFRIADYLYKKTKKVTFLNEILTSAQGQKAGYGLQIDIDYKNLEAMATKNYKSKLVKFVQNHNSAKIGLKRFFEEETAKWLVDNGIAVYVELTPKEIIPEKQIEQMLTVPEEKTEYKKRGRKKVK